MPIVQGESTPRFFRGGDGVLWREYRGWPGEFLRGQEWIADVLDRRDCIEISIEEAERRAGGVPLDGPTMGYISDERVTYYDEPIDLAIRSMTGR